MQADSALPHTDKCSMNGQNHAESCLEALRQITSPNQMLRGPFGQNLNQKFKWQPLRRPLPTMPLIMVVIIVLYGAFMREAQGQLP